MLLAMMLLLLHSCAMRAKTFDLPPQATNPGSLELTGEIMSLGEEIDAEEAQRAARIAIEYSQQLGEKYQVTGSPIFHNILVNLGLRDRGLCIDWTADLMARLRQEKFRSLDLHWAIANYQTTFRLEHSTVVLSAAGESFQQGLVLDPWRNSGDLYWARTDRDAGYLWQAQAEVHALKRSFRAEADVRLLGR